MTASVPSRTKGFQRPQLLHRQRAPTPSTKFATVIKHRPILAQKNGKNLLNVGLLYFRHLSDQTWLQHSQYPSWWHNCRLVMVGKCRQAPQKESLINLTSFFFHFSGKVNAVPPETCWPWEVPLPAAEQPSLPQFVGHWLDSTVRANPFIFWRP